MPVTLSTLFCTAQDVWDLLSVEGVDLREDDHNLATGSLVTVSADAAIGATSISVDALTAPLLRGTQLTFDAAQMTAPVVVTLSVLANVNDTSISVVALTTAIPSAARARDSGVNVATGARLAVGIRKGTNKVKLYCNQRYDDSQLRLSGTVVDWATVAAARFLCTRRAQGCPKSIETEYQESLEEMRMVMVGQLSIDDIGTRGVDWPTITNVIVNPAYNGMRARVQPNISEQTPTAYTQFVDWNSALTLGF